VPAEQRVRRDDRRKLAQRLTTQSIGPHGKLPSVVIGEPEAPPTQLLPQDPILFDQVRQHLSLTPVQPPGDREQQHLDGRDVDHVWELTARLESALPTRSAETWDTFMKRRVKLPGWSKQHWVL
jgi:hypothetical protein